MKIIAHDEDSMTNLFFSEVQRHDKLRDFLKLIEWRSYPALPFTVAEAEIHQHGSGGVGNDSALCPNSATTATTSFPSP